MPVKLARILLAAAFAAGSVLASVPAEARAAGEKVVIIVGPVGGLTDNYRTKADAVAATATAAGATVVKVYSPKATWAKVKAAVAGADVIVYFGHGNGFPSPYSATENPDRVNGWGLNRTETNGDGDSWASTMVYCGEKALLGTLKSSDGQAQWDYCGGKNGTQGISPKPGFVMVYSNACYAPGAGEGHDVPATQDVARARVANYSFPALKLGAGAYFATDLGSAKIVDLVLRKRTTAFGELFKQGNGYSETAARVFPHPDLSGRQMWLQRTLGPGGKLDYWYAFAGDPARTPAGGTASYTPPPPPATITTSRFAGADRYATAAAVSAKNFAPGVPVAYVATGTNFPDALAGGAAAAQRGGPVLLVTTSSVPSVTASELARLKPQEIVVLGGAPSVSDGVANALAAYATSGKVTRIAGADRYATAAAISASTFSPGVPVAYVATGKIFPDALSGVPAGGVGGGPVLLTDPAKLPGSTRAELTRLNPGRIVILGSSAVVSSGVATELGKLTGGGVSRLAGSDRFATSAAVSKATFAKADVVFIATGMNFPDALAGGPVAALDQGPLLLVSSTVSPAVAAELTRLGAKKVVVLGGTPSVSQTVVEQVKQILGG